MFLNLFIFRAHSTWEPASSRLTYFILWTYTGTSVSNSQNRGEKNKQKTGDVREKNSGELTGKAEINKEEIPSSKPSEYGYILTSYRF